MKRLAILGVLALVGASAGAVRAQDANAVGGLLAGGVSLAGQAVADAALDRDSVLATGIGHAKAPALSVETFAINVTGRDQSAVQAAVTRDGRLRQLREVAQRFGVEMDVGASNFSLQADVKAQAARQREFQEGQASHPGVFVPMDTSDLPQMFVAQTEVRFHAPPGDKMAAFLDAVKAAGVDDMSGLVDLNQFNTLRQTFQAFGFGSTEQVDDSVWNEAAADAVRTARAQAEALAGAAGRRVGAAKQIVFLTRGVSNGDASVSVAVRFGFQPDKAP
jgi:uncharacterized protein YggE